MLPVNHLIIGAGLSGLTLSYLLHRAGQSATIIEARDRIGGRILTQREQGKAPIEMGATWLGKKHTALVQLLKELGLPIFEQQLGEHAIYEPISTSPPQLVKLPPNDAPSFRIAGGSDRLIQSLYSSLPADSVRPAEVLKKISLEKDRLIVTTSKAQYQAQRVISTLPPYLLVKTVTFAPGLPQELLSIAQATHTWMGDSIKVGLRSERPFWRQAGSSGTIFSNSGPIPEMYDHATASDDAFALKGFLNGAYHAAGRAARQEVVLQQLSRYYGESIKTLKGYEEKVWRQEPYTFYDYDGYVLPHQHNGHAVYQQAYLEGRLFIAGSETAQQFPGYMEGAVRSAQAVFQALNI
ncbi:MAG: NAD(P)/FAD-dependent oxidoreductase [Bacteroidota bacterium]